MQLWACTSRACYASQNDHWHHGKTEQRAKKPTINTCKSSCVEHSSICAVTGAGVLPRSHDTAS